MILQGHGIGEGDIEREAECRCLPDLLSLTNSSVQPFQEPITPPPQIVTRMFSPLTSAEPSIGDASYDQSDCAG